MLLKRAVRLKLPLYGSTGAGAPVIRDAIRGRLACCATCQAWGFSKRVRRRMLMKTGAFPLSDFQGGLGETHIATGVLSLTFRP
jgi:hypothetical protein